MKIRCKWIEHVFKRITFMSSTPFDRRIFVVYQHTDVYFYKYNINSIQTHRYILSGPSGAVRIWQLTTRKQIKTCKKTISIRAQNPPLFRLYPSYRHETKCKMIQKLSPDRFHTMVIHLDASYDDNRLFSATPHVHFHRRPPSCWSADPVDLLSAIWVRVRLKRSRRKGACQKPIERMKLIKGR